MEEKFLSKWCKVWLQFYLKRHICMYTLYLRKKKNIVLGLFQIDLLNFIMYIWVILTWHLKAYIIWFHNLISMNIFFTKRSVFLYHCKETLENKLLGTKRIIRSSCSLMFFKIDVIKNFLTCKGKHQCWSLFSINLQACNFIKKRLQNRCYPVNITKFSSTPPVAMFLNNHRQY